MKTSDKQRLSAITRRGERKTSVFPKSSSYRLYFITNLSKKHKVDYKNDKKERDFLPHTKVWGFHPEEFDESHD